MKSHSESILTLALVGILAAISYFLGPRVFVFACVLSVLWFGIVFILLTRPPGIPEFVSDEIGSDEQHVVRRDIVLKLTLLQRIRLSLGAAFGSCLLLWLSLVLLSK